MRPALTLLALSALLAPALRAEDFSTFTKGRLTAAKSPEGAWSAEAGHAEIRDGKPSGKALRLFGAGEGKESRSVTFTPAANFAKGGMLTFRAERWSGKAPFKFTVEGLDASGKARSLFDGEKTVKTGAGAEFAVEIPAGVKTLRFTTQAPEGAGVVLSEVRAEAAKPMLATALEVTQPVVPMLIRKKDNPAVSFKISASGQLNPQRLKRVAVTLNGTDNLADIAGVRVVCTNREKILMDDETPYTVFGAAVKPARELVFTGDLPLAHGDNYFHVFIEPAAGASLDRRIDAGVRSASFSDGRTLQADNPEPAGRQRIGYGVRLHGDDKSKFYRIPGLATSNKGTLIAVYDIRYEHGGDLPANIDVGVSRSTDGGQTWGPMGIALDMGKGGKDGVGDPAVLVDPKTGRIWVAALWSHGNRAWAGSGKGMTPDETGQLVLAYSDDDGLTWSKPVNITEQVKKPDWHLFFNGPGAGIAMKDGTLVFPAQYQDGDLNAQGRKKGTPFSTLIVSKDGGKTWKTGTGIKSDTTEAQVVELADGSLMLNCRDNRGGFRTVGVTNDLGATWTLHETDRKALPCPVCQGSILRVDTDKHGPLLVFSNPAISGGWRSMMTMKISKDMGATWPAEMHTLYDSRFTSGYSSIAPIGKDAVGALYEGRNEIWFVRFPLKELLGESPTPAK